MSVTPSEEKLPVCSLYKLAINVVYQCYVKNDSEFDIKAFPDPIAFDLLHQCFKNDEKRNLLFSKMDIIILIRLLRYEEYRPQLMKFYQSLINDGHSIGQKMEADFEKMSQNILNTDNAVKHIYYGLRLGSFLSEGSWYPESERILRLTLKLTRKLSYSLPETVLLYKLLLECYHRLFHTLTMYFKFDAAAQIFTEIITIKVALEQRGEYLDYTILYTEFSKYSFLKNNYEESFMWIKEAINCLNSRSSIPTQIQVLRQASKVCVVKRDIAKAKILMHQALTRAEQYYVAGYYKLASLLQDFGFYLLNSDNIKQSADVYEDAYNLRIKMFGSTERNLHIAIAEEDWAYALYVLEYSSGYFESAIEHAQRAIKAMKVLLPSNNLMLSSANRVKALILEEMAIDNFLNNDQEDINLMLNEAERLHQDALTLTKDTFGEENILTAKHYGNLGRLYQSMQKYQEAENMHLKAIQIKEAILGPDDYEVGLSVGHLASLYNYHMKEYRKAEQLYYRSININLKLFSESYSGLEYDYKGLIHVYEHLGDSVQKSKFAARLHEWTKLKSLHVPDLVGTELYKVIDMVPIETIINIFEPLHKATAEKYCKKENSNDLPLQSCSV